ncbi:hypothetical protein [Methylocystis echinoides]|uniref:Uncharacterized protein n=1 Tax=Methylocystis echinoides TaxID=29468 RepID=A0A9W6LRL8_9HYPH|nr:hypothetical protein [Methylocystis echinoides]GLI92587.1 hypothetical protein LMG27198_15790 [Methylocystis echinoides]
MTAYGRAESAATAPRKSSHAYRNARQALLLLDHARRAGLQRTFAAGMARIGEVEAAIRSYRPDMSEATEYSEALSLIGEMKVEAGRL